MLADVDTSIAAIEDVLGLLVEWSSLCCGDGGGIIVWPPFLSALYQCLTLYSILDFLFS